jgi:hypothetical protein
MDLNHIGQRGHGCLVLGAGATRGATFVERAPRLPLPPLDADFFTQIQRMTQPANRALASRLLRFVVGEFGVGFQLTMERFFTQVETLPQIFDQLRIARGQSYRQPEQALKLFRLALAAVFQESLMTEVNGEPTYHRCGSHNLLAGALDGHDSIISFNYDCVIEESLRINCPAWSPLHSYGVQFKNVDLPYWLYQAKGNARYRRNHVGLYKMHGSMNWRRDGRGISLAPLPYRTSDEHAIVPPQWQKDVIGPTSIFRPVWRQARSALESAELLVIAGYSAPLTDLLAQTLFRCRNRPTGKTVGANHLRLLAIANPDRSARRHLLQLLKNSIDDRTQVLTFDSLTQCANHLVSAHR